MAYVFLMQATRVSAEATVERLQGLGIDAQLVDAPNVFARLSSAGTYRVRVAVPEGELERARGELARWELEAGPRVARLGRTVGLIFFFGSLPALVMLAVLFWRGESDPKLALGTLCVWLGGLLGLAYGLRLRERRIRRSGALPEIEPPLA
ncbi:MAG: hypothetical protein ABL998_16595 [Planctomycetota bacterium]